MPTHPESLSRQLQDLMLKLTAIQSNLAAQDKLLAKLDTAVHGNGRPGVLTRIDRLERIASALTKSIWLLTAALVTAAFKLIVDHFN